MGIGDLVGLSHVLAVAAVTFTVSACDLEPCGSLDLSATHTRGYDQDGPTVIALSDGGQIKVVRVCTGFGECEAELAVHAIPLGAAPDQLMLTASGRWLTYRVGSVASRIDLDDLESNPIGIDGVDELIGSLRGGDWLIYRTLVNGGQGDDQTGTTQVNGSELWAVYVGDEDELPEEEQTTPQFRLGAGLDLRVVAVGHRHVVARRSLGDGREELYLVRIAPAYHVDNYGSSTRGDPLLLARGQTFRRVMITDGPSPAERGDPWEFQHEVPTDAHVVATSGAGSDARTLIYSVADTTQIANFEGEVVTSRNDLEDVPGLSPVSPDGTHLAYITPRGSLALRNLEDQSSCMVRPASASRHLLAGFAADGTVYFESEERRPSRAQYQSTSVAELVYAYDPLAREFTVITDDPGVWRLQAVPPQRYVGDDLEPGSAKPIPWAIVGLDGDHLARPGLSPTSLAYKEASFVPRGDESLWVLEAEQQTNDDDSRLTLHRIQPELVDGALQFDTQDADPTVQDDSERLYERFSHEYSGTTTVCVSASQSASHTTPWATRCSAASEPEEFLDNGLPEGEQGP